MAQQQPQPDTSTATPSTVTHLGCFNEQIRSPDLNGEPPLSITRAEACFTHCSIGTWSFAAIRNGTICTCGDSEQRKYGLAPESSCSTKCPETQSAFDECGGPEANSVYFVGAMTPKVPWPTPSINPTNPNAIVTPPSSDDGDRGNGGGNNGMLGNTKHASTAVIASVAAVAGVAVLAIATLLVHRRKNKGRRSMSSMEDGSGGGSSNCRFDRHDKGSLERSNKSSNNNTAAVVDPYSRARTGHSWFVTGHRDLATLDDNDSIDGDDDNDVDDGTEGWKKEYLSRSGSRKKEHQDLFEGFESSVMDEDRSIHLHPSEERHRSIETAPNNSDTLAVANGPIIHHDSSTSTITSSDDTSSTTTTTSSFPLGQPGKSSFATKIGLKMGHLKVKVPTHHHDGSNAPATTDHAPVSPISPISPISPTSRSSSTSSTTTAPAFNSTTTSYLDIERGAGGIPERSPTSATPSFSFASAPVPGPASNLQEAKKSPHHHNHSHKHHHNHNHHEPPSPISPQKQSIPSPTSPRYHGSSQGGGINSRHQKKQHRSDLIKDLILQGDSALEDKELALMAQYQPHHCWQQQHHAAANAAAAAAAATPTMPPKVARRTSLEHAEKPALETKTMAAAPAPAPAALIIPSPRDYLAPPPRILVHKAL
ncbi:MAG: hypothetical protein JOS17DRAFT_486126 [Linnemannia elongata]|nr:MAG: hypothetical protein JOS17DRAFT_486126 [Linnemannia elongata]